MLMREGVRVLVLMEDNSHTSRCRMILPASGQSSVNKLADFRGYIHVLEDLELELRRCGTPVRSLDNSIVAGTNAGMIELDSLSGGGIHRLHLRKLWRSCSFGHLDGCKG